MNDLISRQALIEAIVNTPSLVQDETIPLQTQYDGETFRQIEILGIIESMPPAQQWISFKSRPLTAEEKEEHPEWDFILDCPLPDDGDAILVSTKKYVAEDAFYNDEDGAYLDSGWVIGEDVIAWQPLPEPFKEEV